MSTLVLKNGIVVDGLTNKEQRLDILIEGTTIRAIDRNIDDRDALIIDVSGKIVMPGLVDVHVHFRQPGQEHKETISTGMKAAAAGGYTTVIAEPNTLPPIDSASRLSRLLTTAQREGLVRFYSKACITKGGRGKRLVDVVSLKAAGALALSDDGNPVPGRTLMQHALAQARHVDLLINPHCEESEFYRSMMLKRYEARLGQRCPVHRRISTGVPFSPTERYRAETAFIKRDLELAAQTGARIHISHVSLASSVEEIAKAKQRGVAVTAEATPHHFVLTEEDAEQIGTNAKVNPPLRSKSDVEAIRQGLSDGTIDIIATDHAPHTPSEKALPWDQAPFGVIGLETAVGVVFTYLVASGILSVANVVEKMSVLPAKIFRLPAPAGMLARGQIADITVIDPHAVWKVDATRFYSKGRNCPFDGWELHGRPVLTIQRGSIIMKDGLINTAAR